MKCGQVVKALSKQKRHEVPYFTTEDVFANKYKTVTTQFTELSAIRLCHTKQTLSNYLLLDIGNLVIEYTMCNIWEHSSHCIAICDHEGPVLKWRTPKWKPLQYQFHHPKYNPIDGTKTMWIQIDFASIY